MELTTELLWALIPLIILNLVLIIICFLDWLKRENFRYLPKYAWLLVFLFVNLIGSVLYLTLAKGDDSNKM